MAYINYDDVKIKHEFEKFFNRKSIAEQCTKESLTRLYKQFLITKNEEMDKSQLNNAFVSILNIKLSSEAFNILFRKINFKNDGYVTWNEFISYLLMEFQLIDVSIQHQMLQLPVTGTPVILRAHHRTPICRIDFYPELLPDRSRSFQRGCYLTISRDGVINYWSLDFKYERTVQSTNPFLKIQQTAITDMILMPDVQIICVSSSERDLRFYDVVAKKFELRVMISSLDHVVSCMSYYFSSKINENSYIILGDESGSITIMTFSSIEKGPFKQQPEYNTLFIRYEAIIRDELPGLKVTVIKRVHTNWVNQVAYYGSLRAFMSSSRCSECSLLLSDPTRIRIHYKFIIERGISCFNFCEESQILVTGGPDCIVRVWNPFVPKKASNTFQGHKATICAIIIQNLGQRIFSLSKDRCIKVWDVPSHTCIQTYNGLQFKLNENIKVSVIYNDLTHKMIIAGMVIAIVVCGQVINKETSDGITHTKPVSSVLYNHLYKVIVSTGLDSCIIVWDPWLGRRLYLVTNAHSILLYGQYVNIEITAATFDDSEHLLITGARNGSLKIWNFNTGTCLRNMTIEDQCEITSLSWVENRVLCTGWNRRVTEFTISELDTYKKSWELIHTDDILFSAVRYPQVLTTASYNGEIIFWQLETGQPYRRYQVSNATGRFDIKYKSYLKEDTKQQTSSIKEIKLEKESFNEGYLNTNQSGNNMNISSHQESAINITRSVTVTAIIYLNSRPIHSNIGTLLVSLESGIIQVWSHHPSGGFLGGFSVIHARRDSAISLATDPENNYLITGHCLGYIKVWYIANYMIPNPPKLCMPLLRLEFPFLWRDQINGRAKRAVKDQPLPLLLSSHRGHTKSITCLQLIPNARIIISGSLDNTVRLWTLGGRYISTLGTFKEWMPILPNIPAYQYFQHFRYPMDIKRSASFTTMKVLQGGLGSVEAKDIDESDYLKEIPEEGRLMLYGIQLESPYLGNYFKVYDKTRHYIEPIILDNSLTHIPVYTHLTTHDLNHVESKLSLIVHNKKELH